MVYKISYIAVSRYLRATGRMQLCFIYRVSMYLVCVFSFQNPDRTNSPIWDILCIRREQKRESLSRTTQLNLKLLLIFVWHMLLLLTFIGQPS